MSPGQCQQTPVGCLLYAGHEDEPVGVLGLLPDDTLTMGPLPLGYPARGAGRRPDADPWKKPCAVLGYRSCPRSPGQITLVPARANMQPAVAAYVRDPGSRWATAYGIMVLTIDGSAIGVITGFADPALFPFFDLPGHLEA